MAQTPVRTFKSFLQYQPIKELKKREKQIEESNKTNFVWNFAALSTNSNLSWSDIDKYEIELEKKRQEEEQLRQEKSCREWQAISCIKRKRIRIFWDVSHSVGSKRCERSFLNENYQVWG